MVTFHPSIHDGRVSLLSNAFLGNIVICPLGVSPHRGVNFSKLAWSASVVLNGLFERFVEVPVVQKHIWIVIPSVEMPLDRLHRLDYTIQLFISRENDEGCVGSGTTGVDLEAAGVKNFIMLLANFSAQPTFVSASYHGRESFSGNQCQTS